MVIDLNTPPKSNYWNVTPLIKTEWVNVGNKPHIKATVLVGQMTITAFSDEVQETPDNPIQDYARQATQRAMNLIPAD